MFLPGSLPDFPIDTEKPDPITGTLLHHPTADAEGKIVLIQSPSYPYEPMLRTLALQRPKAVIITQKRRGEAGEGMFYVDGRDRSGITFPVAETYITNENNVSRLPDGAVVTIVFDENPWKAAKMENKFQVVFGFLLSFWQLIILAIGSYRLYQFYQAEIKVSWLSIGPVCLVLEMVSVALRLAFTCVDPFWSQRMLPNSAGNAFFTIHMPFQLASGILLTFYWAETLRTTKIKASPFISDYRIVAIVVVVLLFVAEAVIDAIRITQSGSTRFSPIIITVVFYIIISAILTVCYIICAVAIMGRIEDMTQSPKRFSRVRKMTLRFVLSTAGYIVTIIMEIVTATMTGRPWGTIISFNLLFVALNWTATLQIVGLKPLKGARSSSSDRKETFTDASV